MGRAVCALIGLVAMTMALPAPASATEVWNNYSDYAEIIDRDSAKEAYTVTRQDDGSIRIDDAYDTIKTVTGSVRNCTDKVKVTTCPPGMRRIDVHLGGGDDWYWSFAPASLYNAVYGGDGNDQIVHGGAGNYITGGAGDDVVVGCGGDDYLHGGPGTNFLMDYFVYACPDSGGRELIDGREGVTYAAAGAGNDNIDVADMRWDNTIGLDPHIDCGSGDDRVDADGPAPPGLPIDKIVPGDNGCEKIWYWTPGVSGPVIRP